MTAGAKRTQFVPAHLWVLAACVVVAVLHQATHWGWTIEDAAICYAYARNIATGEGAVPFPGGERIEGFSDPTWVALLSVFHWLGFDGWSTAKPLGMLFGAAAVVVVWRIAREALPDHNGPGALIAPILLALNAQFAIWGASGLESAMFGFFLAMGLWRVPIEVRERGRPWSSLWFLLLAWTRPEGAIYAAIGAFWFAVGGWRARREILPLVRWLALFWIPFAVLEAGRLWYFAWPLPNTYYAKIHSPWLSTLDWEANGWVQLRGWADRLWQGFWVPVYALGMTSIRGWRARVALGLVVGMALLLLWPGTEPLLLISWWPELPPPPEGYLAARAVFFLAVAATLPFLALGTPGDLTRGLCGHALAFGVLFSVTSDGDWMGGFRWMSLIAVPASVVLTVGIVEIVDAVEARLGSGAGWSAPGWLAASLATGLAIPPNFSMTRDHRFWNFDVTPQLVLPRVNYLRFVADRTFYEGEIRHFEIDQGAFLWFVPHFHQYDLALLVDVPAAHHWWQQRAFVQEYVFEEMRPTFVNIGIRNRWTRLTGLHEYPQWDATLFELPGYPNRHGLPFIGVFARRELVMADRWEPGPERRVRLAQDWTLEGLALPVPWEAGGRGYLELPISSGRLREADAAQMLVFIHREGRVESWQIPLGYNLMPLNKWAIGEVFRGRHAVVLPADLQPGTYDLGVVLLDAQGAVIPAIEAPPQARIGGAENPPLFAAGEVVFEGVVDVRAPQAVDGFRAERLERLFEEAAEGACDRAETDWVLYKRARPDAREVHAQTRPQVARAIADCLARSAEGAGEDAAALLRRAHEWDHWSPELERVGGVLAPQWLAEADRARADGDWEVAYRRYDQVLGFQPWRSWARRWAEYTRDRRLGIQDDVRRGRRGGADELAEYEALQRAAGQEPER